MKLYAAPLQGFTEVLVTTPKICYGNLVAI